MVTAMEVAELQSGGVNGDENEAGSSVIDSPSVNIDWEMAVDCLRQIDNSMNPHVNVFRVFRRFFNSWSRLFTAISNIYLCAKQSCRSKCHCTISGSSYPINSIAAV